MKTIERSKEPLCRSSLQMTWMPGGITIASLVPLTLSLKMTSPDHDLPDGLNGHPNLYPACRWWRPFTRFRGKAHGPAQMPFLFGWPDVMWAAPGVIPSSRGIQSVIPSAAWRNWSPRLKLPIPKLWSITGGEPLMHDLTALTEQLRNAGLQVHLETSVGASLQRHL